MGSVTTTRSTRRRAAAAHDLGAERHQLERVGDDRGAVHRREPGDRRDRTPQILLPFVTLGFGACLCDQLRQFGERRLHAVEHRRHDRLAPGLGARRHHQKRAAAMMGAHRRGQLHQHVHLP